MMIWFRAFLMTCLLSILLYTGVTIDAHGWGLLPIFFGDMTAMTWPGQFNFDFSPSFSFRHCGRLGATTSPSAVSH